jgi:hypothetical protein
MFECDKESVREGIEKLLHENERMKINGIEILDPNDIVKIKSISIAEKKIQMTLQRRRKRRKKIREKLRLIETKSEMEIKLNENKCSV